MKVGLKRKWGEEEMKQAEEPDKYYRTMLKIAVPVGVICTIVNALVIVVSLFM